MKKSNENIKLIIVGIVISSIIATKAATTLSSTSVYYDTSKSGGSSSVTLSTSNLPSHSHVIPSLSVSSCSGTSFSVQNPYTVVYMYKRTA